MRSRLYLAAAALLCTGCGILDPGQCATVVVPGLSITVQDLATGKNVRGPLVVIAREGTYADTAHIYNPTAAAPDSMDFNPYQLVMERPGTYDISVQAPGYGLWHVSGIQVIKGRCHVNTVQIVAQME